MHLLPQAGGQAYRELLSGGVTQPSRCHAKKIAPLLIQPGAYVVEGEMNGASTPGVPHERSLAMVGG